MIIKRGEILLIEFDPARGSEIKKTRPGIVVTNNIPNIYSRVLMIVPVTSQNTDKIYPHEVLLIKPEGLTKESKANISQMKAIDRSRIKSKVGKISLKNLNQIDSALKLHLGLV